MYNSTKYKMCIFMPRLPPKMTQFDQTTKLPKASSEHFSIPLVSRYAKQYTLCTRARIIIIAICLYSILYIIFSFQIYMLFVNLLEE